MQSQKVIENSSKIVYGDESDMLPENHNGLGHLNILYLLLKIEMVREEFEARQSTLNFLIIEEPEAHTHPQMQYVFASQIKGLIDKIPRLQAVLTTHSSHIVSKSEFEDIRYLSKTADQENVEIKNFHTELSKKFEDVHQRITLDCHRLAALHNFAADASDPARMVAQWKDTLPQ